jgi:hypothetical protein
MSQFYQGTTAGSLPPAVPLQFTTEDGVAVPAGNNLNVESDSTDENNEDGITTEGSGDTVTILLTNRLFGGVGTVGADTATAVSFTLPAIANVYTFEIKVAGYESATPSGIGFSLFVSVISDGATATKIGVTDKIKNAQAPLAACDAEIVTSGNDVEVQVTGVAGLNITWTVVGYYVQGV